MSGRRSAAKLLTRDEARRIAANIAKLLECYTSRELAISGQNLASVFSDQVSFSVRPLVTANLPELSGIQRLKYIADQIAFYDSFQILAADPCFGCIFSTPQCQAPRLVLTIRARHHLDVFNFPLSQKLFRLLAHDQSFGPVELNRQRETLKQTRITCRC